MDDIERIERHLKLHDVRVLFSVVQAGSMHKGSGAPGNFPARHFEGDCRPRTRAWCAPPRSQHQWGRADARDDVKFALTQDLPQLYTSGLLPHVSNEARIR